MLGASWAQRRSYSLRLARNAQPWRQASRSVALALPKHTVQDADTERPPRAPKFSTLIPTVADRTATLLRERKVEEAATALSQFSNEEDHEQFVVEVVDRFLNSENQHLDPDTLFSWLESFPDATTASSAVFHQVFDRIVDHGGDNLALVYRLGLLCASKGYRDFVSVHISPFIAERGSGSVVRDWERQVALAVEEFKGLQSAAVVLEDDGKDYQFTEPPIPRPPSVLQQVEATLPAFLPEPTLEDGLVFEEEEVDDYVTLSPPPTTSSSGRSRTFDVLFTLLQEQKFDEGYRLSQELQNIGVVPPVDLLLATPKSYLERLSKLKPLLDGAAITEYQTLFVKWMDFLPSARELDVSTSEDFKSIERLLYGTNTPNLFLLSYTARLLASKGYPSRTFQPAVQILLTHPESKTGVDFIQELEHSQRRAGITSDHSLRETAIRSLASVHRFHATMQLLRGTNSSIQVSQSTLDLLLRQMRLAGPEMLAKYEDEILSMTPRPTNKSTPHPPPPTPIDIDADSELGASFLSLSRAIHPSLPPPHPSLILSFIHTCVAAGRPDLLTALLNHARATSPLATTAVLHAEMLYYYRRREFDALVEVVEDHFYYGGGLPEAVVHLHQRPRWKRALRSRKRPMAYRLHDRAALDLGGPKLWPSSSHCDLLWQSVILQTDDDAQLRGIYEKLVECVQGARRVVPVVPVSPATGEPGPSAIVDLMDLRMRNPTEGPFSILIGKVIQIHGRRGPAKAAKILSKMVDLGLTPDITHFTMLMQAYARISQQKHAMEILEKLEANLHAVKTQQEGGKEEGSVKGKRLPYGSPENVSVPQLVPDVTLYALLAKGFLHSKNYGSARMVLERMRRVLGVDPEASGDVHLRSVLKRLRAAAQRSQRPKSGGSTEGAGP